MWCEDSEGYSGRHKWCYWCGEHLNIRLTKKIIFSDLHRNISADGCDVSMTIISCEILWYSSIAPLLFAFYLFVILTIYFTLSFTVSTNQRMLVFLLHQFHTLWQRCCIQLVHTGVQILKHTSALLFQTRTSQHWWLGHSSKLQLHQHSVDSDKDVIHWECSNPQVLKNQPLSAFRFRHA